jgi:hypothetical protein
MRLGSRPARLDPAEPPARTSWLARLSALLLARRADRHPPSRPFPALTGLALGVLALGPGLRRGFLLSYDMVFVPRMPFSAALLGLTGGPPRAVPSDAVIAVASLAVPADIVQKIVLLLIFVLACSGAAALLASAWTAARGPDGGAAPMTAQLAAGVCYAWNPYIAERLLIGQWALLLGYAGLPWVMRVLCSGPERIRLRRLAFALIPAAIGTFIAMCVTAVAAVPAALSAGPRARRIATVLAGLALLSLPWLIPSLAVPVHTDPRGVDAFAARADTPFGRLGSLLLLSGIWNAQTVPRGYGGAASVFWLLVVVASLCGFVFWAGRLRAGLGLAALAGLLVAAIGVTAAGRAALRDLVAASPGFAVLRDGPQFLAPLALAEAIGLGTLVACVSPGGTTPQDPPAAHPLGPTSGRPSRLSQLRKPAARRTEGARAAVAALGVMAVLAPVVLLPGMAWGMAGRLRPVEYPADWLPARQVIDDDPAAGTVLLLPWAAYRRYPWNHGEAVYDPWARFTSREVISNDALDVGSLTVAQESADSIRLNRIVTAPGPLTRALRGAGVLYVVVDAGPVLEKAAAPGSTASELAASARLPGAQLIMASRDLVVFRLAGAPAARQSRGLTAAAVRPKLLLSQHIVFSPGSS